MADSGEQDSDPNALEIPKLTYRAAERLLGLQRRMARKMEMNRGIVLSATEMDIFVASGDEIERGVEMLIAMLDAHDGDPDREDDDADSCCAGEDQVRGNAAIGYPYCGLHDDDREAGTWWEGFRHPIAMRIDLPDADDVAADTPFSALGAYA